MAKVPNAVQILQKITTAWVGFTSVTDRQTTDGRAIAYSSLQHTLLLKVLGENSQQAYYSLLNIRRTSITLTVTVKLSV